MKRLILPFIEGDKVIAVDAMFDSVIKNETLYTIKKCFWDREFKHFSVTLVEFPEIVSLRGSIFKKHIIPFDEFNQTLTTIKQEIGL
jgi:hypothetical protein